MRESSKQESRDKTKINTIIRKKGKNRPGEGKPPTENEENETALMCWEVLNGSTNYFTADIQLVNCSPLMKKLRAAMRSGRILV